MPHQANTPNRRDLLRLASLTALGALVHPGRAQSTPIPLFDGKTLDGWIPIENNATSLSAAGIADPAAFAVWLTNGSDALSEYLRTRLQDSVKADLANFSPSAANAKTVISALVKDLNQVVAGPSIDHIPTKVVDGDDLRRQRSLLFYGPLYLPAISTFDRAHIARLH